jgi:hypothetical protein
MAQIPGQPDGPRRDGAVKPHRVRVVLTDGQRTVDFAWLRHAGKQVVCGAPNDPEHVTYPRDGRVHITTEEGSKKRRRGFFTLPPVPLQGFHGQHGLLTLGLAEPILQSFDLVPFRHQAQDTIAFLDLRAFRPDAAVMVDLGLVEAGHADQLNFAFKVQQILLVTSVTPWVYLAAGTEAGIITR